MVHIHSPNQLPKWGFYPQNITLVFIFTFTKTYAALDETFGNVGGGGKNDSAK